MYLPRRVYWGRGAMEEMGEWMEGEPVYFCGPKTCDLVEGKKIVVERASWDCVRVVKGDYIVGVGGGKNIDVGKASAWKSSLPFVSFPTILSNDGIASPIASLLGPSGRKSVYTTTPYAVFAEEEILLSSPQKYLLSGFGDMVAKYSSLYDWLLAHKVLKERYSPTWAALLKKAVEEVMVRASGIKRRTKEGIKALFDALILSGMVISVHGSSRPASGSEHAIAHVLDSMGVQGTHGQKVGILTILTSYFQGRDWEKVKATLERAGMEPRLPVSRKTLVEAVLRARGYRNRYTILDHIDVSRERVEKAVKEVDICDL